MARAAKQKTEGERTERKRKEREGRRTTKGEIKGNKNIREKKERGERTSGKTEAHARASYWGQRRWCWSYQWSSEEAEDNELDWLTELSEIKPKCAGCSFLAKQVYQLQKELKELNEKCHRSKVIYTSTWVPPILSSYQMSCLQNYRQLFMGTHWLSFLTLVMTLSVPRKLFDLRCCNISCIAFQEYSGCIALSYLRT